MDPNRFRTLIEIVGDALERPLAERDAWLVSRCANDVALLAEARALLNESNSSTRAAFTARFEAGVLRASADALAVDRAGERAGAYRLLEMIGQGGMGTVYRAERADDEYRAHVAIKFVRGALAAPDLERRLRAERQILADLNHPNIARLLDGGTAPDGTPFIVLEYLDGQPIDVWCDTRALGIRARISLFLQVCSAVSHAHGAGVIHRDIKPSNIMVTADGTPKLVDFGIAKLLDDGGSSQQTATLRVLTPVYASPEQMLGTTVSVASDIYSLGVVLYELLIGRPPFELKSLTAGAAERMVVRERVRAPSRAASTHHDEAWCRELAPLDHLLLQMLHKEPAARPASVDDLAASLERYLQMPARARRAASVRFAAQRFMMRKSVRLAAVLVVLATATAMFARARGLTPVPKLGAFEFRTVQQAASPIPPPYHVLTADVNGDGRGDLIWSNVASGSNLTYVGVSDSAGSFALRPVVRHSATPPEGWAAYEALAGDFNGDGRDDLVWRRAEDRGINRVYVGLSNGDGTFRLLEEQVIGSPRWAAGWQAHVVDIDGDSDDDLIYNYLVSENAAFVARSDGAGRFQLSARITNRAAVWNGYRLFIADADGDGRLDIIWNDVPTYDNRTYVARPLGEIFELESAQNHPGIAGDSTRRAWAGYTTLQGDINGDRATDLVWVNTAGDPIILFRAFGRKSARFRFAPSLTIARPSDADTLAAQLADFNADGRADLLLYDSDARRGRFWITLATRTGGFQGGFTVAQSPPDAAIDAAAQLLLFDVSGDGVKDVVWNEFGEVMRIRVALTRPR